MQVILFQRIILGNLLAQVPCVFYMCSPPVACVVNISGSNMYGSLFVSKIIIIISTVSLCIAYSRKLGNPASLGLTFVVWPFRRKTAAYNHDFETIGGAIILGGYMYNAYYNTPENHKHYLQCGTGHIELQSFSTVRSNEYYSFKQFTRGSLPWHLDLYPGGKKNTVSFQHISGLFSVERPELLTCSPAF